MNAPHVNPASVLDDEKAAPRQYSPNYITKFGKRKMAFFCDQTILDKLKSNAKRRNQTTAQQIRDSIQLYLHVCEEQDKQQQA